MSLFQKLKIVSPRNTFGEIPPEAIYNFLLRAAQHVLESGFEWVNLNCPPEGSIIIIKIPAEVSTINSDGYGWMDDENRTVVKVDGHDIEIFERVSGFKPIEKFASVKRRRYRILNHQISELQILHYLPIDNNSIKIPVINHLVKERPALASSLQQQDIAKKQLLTQQAQRHATQRYAFDEEVSGDELDETTSRQMAINRFKRNTNYIEEIFSPYSIADIIPPQSDNSSTESIEALKAKLLSKKQELEKQKAEYSEAITKFQGDSVAIWDGIEEIKTNAKKHSLEDIQDEVEKHLNIKFQSIQPSLRRREVFQDLHIFDNDLKEEAQ